MPYSRGFSETWRWGQSSVLYSFMNFVRLFLVFLFQGILPSTAQAQHIPGQDLSDLVEQLVTDDNELRKTAETEAKKNGEQIVGQLIRKAERSRNPREFVTNIYRSGLVISPWLRGKERSARFVQYMSFIEPGFPVDRPVNHPVALRLRELLMSHIGSAADQREIRIACEILAEVADDKTIDWSFSVLEKIREPNVGEPLVTLIDSRLGLRPTFRSLGICGNSTPAQFEEFEASERKRFIESVSQLKKTWGEIRPLPKADRHKFLIDHWRNYIVPNQESYSGSFIHSQERLFQELEPLIRQGKPILAAIKDQQRLEPKLETKAVWEVVLATISGEENKELVSELLDQKGDPYWELACEIILGARSVNWLDELEELQQMKYFDNGIASEIAAAIHRDAAIPSLNKALEYRSGNYHAEYSIKELKARKLGKLSNEFRLLNFWY